MPETIAHALVWYSASFNFLPDGLKMLTCDVARTADADDYVTRPITPASEAGIHDFYHGNCLTYGNRLEILFLTRKILDFKKNSDERSNKSISSNQI